MFLPLLGCFALLIGSFGCTTFTLPTLPALPAGPSSPWTPFGRIPFLRWYWAISTFTTPQPTHYDTSPLTSLLFRPPTSTGPWIWASRLSILRGSTPGSPSTCPHA